MQRLLLLLISSFLLCQCQVQPQQQQQQQQQVATPIKGYKMSAYTVRGKRYHPMSVEKALQYKEEGVASFYEGSGGKTAIGERPRKGQLYAAHKTLPLPCQVRVTCLATGKSVDMRVNDRGPFVGNRIIDVSKSAANKLGFQGRGLQRVRVEVLSVGDGQYKRVAH